MKSLLTMLAVLAMLATGAYAVTADSTTWEGSYEANVLPTADGWTADGTPDGVVAGGILTFTNGDGPWNGYLNNGVFSPVEAIGASWEIRMKLGETPTAVGNFYSAIPSVNPSMQFRVVGGDHGGAPYFRYNFGTINDLANHLDYVVDPTEMHTYRITIEDHANPNWVTAKLYVDGNPVPVDEASNNAAGAWNPWGASSMDMYPQNASSVMVDHFRWTAEGAFPAPEPATLAMLTGGLLLLARRRT